MKFFLNNNSLVVSRNYRILILFILLMAGELSAQTISLPPTGYDTYVASIPHGKTEVVSYYSSTVGINRSTRVYLPPGYTRDSTYNVLYLLHGIGGDINEWVNYGSPILILDNLYAKGKIAPMIVVLPNGRAMVDDSPGSNIYAADKVAGFANFEFELIKDLIPFIDTTYPVNPGREARAIAGLSMGGGQALNFGLGHLDHFAWVGAFSPAPNTKSAATLIPDLRDTSKISGLWISCGSADGLLYVSQNSHNYFTDKHIDHDYLVETGKGHDWSVWKPGLYHFSQRIFGRSPANVTTTVNPELQSGAGGRFIYCPSEQTLTYTGADQLQEVSVFDMNGRLIAKEYFTQKNSVKIGNPGSGIYIVVAGDGKKYIRNKLKF